MPETPVGKKVAGAGLMGRRLMRREGWESYGWPTVLRLSDGTVVYATHVDGPGHLLVRGSIKGRRVADFRFMSKAETEHEGWGDDRGMVLVLDNGAVVIASQDAQGSAAATFKFARAGHVWMHLPGATEQRMTEIDDTYTEPLGIAERKPLVHTPSRLETEAPKVARKVARAAGTALGFAALTLVVGFLILEAFAITAAGFQELFSGYALFGLLILAMVYFGVFAVWARWNEEKRPEHENTGKTENVDE